MLTPSAGLSWGNHAAHSFKRRTDQFDPRSPSTLPDSQILNSFVLVPRCAARCAVGCHL